jgi:hypothetical protein
MMIWFLVLGMRTSKRIFCQANERGKVIHVFHQYSATACGMYKFGSTVEIFGDDIISCGLWPPCFPDLTPLEVKKVVYNNSPHSGPEHRG